MSRLDTDSCVDGDLVEIELHQHDYDELLKSGLINEWNTTLGVMIDEFEDESIPADSLDIAIKIYEKYTNNLNTEKATQLGNVLKLARKINTRVFFFL